MIERIGVFDSGMGGLTVLRQLRAAHRDRKRSLNQSVTSSQMR